MEQLTRIAIHDRVLRMIVTVFCGSQTKPGDARYNEAYHLGILLAMGGHTVMSGGYIGAMEAISKGAAEAGGHVIGVTCDEIENWRPVRPNRWIQEERRFPTVTARLIELVRGCDAAIALPGGPGTLTELSLAWNLMIVQSMPIKPLILLGEGWQAIMLTFFQSYPDLIPQDQRNLILFAPNNEEALKIINRKLK